MKINANLTKIIGRSEDKKWVALSRDRSKLVGSNNSLEKLREELGTKKDSVVYMKVLSSDTEFVCVV